MSRSGERLIAAAKEARETILKAASEVTPEEYAAHFESLRSRGLTAVYVPEQE